MADRGGKLATETQGHRGTALRASIRRRGPAEQAHRAAVNRFVGTNRIRYLAARSHEPFTAARAASRRAVEAVHATAPRSGAVAGSLCASVTLWQPYVDSIAA